MGALSPRPPADAVPAFYAGYVARVPDGEIDATLATQLDATVALLAPLSEEQALHRYAPGKWSIKEVIGHVADAERVFAYRILRFARGDATPLAGFDENVYVPAGRFDDRPLEDLMAELRAVRAATVALLRGLPPDTLDRPGTANGVPLTARAIAWISAGHELHHRHILRERYLPSR
ncbi:MAG TPA: DinB family protein [Longimicrobiales bacterium]|nr:DinB family protein [Longimicrobiales bacterium]